MVDGRVGMPVGSNEMNTIVNEMKPVAALAMSAVMGAVLVLGAVAMMGSATPAKSGIGTPQLLVGISRYNTPDIRVAPMLRPAAR